MKWLKNRYVQISAAFVIGGFLGYTFYPTKSIEERIRVEVNEEYKSTLELYHSAYQSTNEKLQEQLTETEKSSKEFKEETNKKVNILTTENRQLKQKVKKRKFKLIKPDGTIIEREFEESDTQETSSVVTSIKEEFTRKVSQIESKWKKIHVDRIKALKTKFEEELKKKETKTVIKEKIVEKEKIVKVNEKKFRPEIGINNDKDIYLHGTYPLWGPFFLGGGVSGGGSLDKVEFGDVRVGVGIEF